MTCGMTYSAMMRYDMWYNVQYNGFSPSAPESPTPQDFSFDDAFDSESFPDNSPVHCSTTSPLSSDLGLKESKRASVLAIPIPAAKVSLSPEDCIGMDYKDYDEELDIAGLSPDAISTAKELLHLLWNVGGWGGRQ
jgi:hypothetical protein